MAANHIKEGRIRVVQQKTGAVLWVPLHSDLIATLQGGAQGRMYLIKTRDNKPRAVKGFYNWFKAACRKAGVDQKLSPHGLRKTAATRLSDVGCSAAEICAITGHKSIAEMEKYIRDRDQMHLADSAITRLEQNGKVSNRVSNLEKTQQKQGPWQSLGESNPSFQVENLAS